jgi:hypothetical protein
MYFGNIRCPGLDFQAYQHAAHTTSQSGTNTVPLRRRNRRFDCNPQQERHIQFYDDILINSVELRN